MDLNQRKVIILNMLRRIDIYRDDTAMIGVIEVFINMIKNYQTLEAKNNDL